MKKWEKTQDGPGSNPVYKLTPEYSPDWFAQVYKSDGRWKASVGRRIKGYITDRTVYTLKGKWKSKDTAKKKALETIISMQTI